MSDEESNRRQVDGFVTIHVGAPPERFAALAADHAKWRSVAISLFTAAEKLWPYIEIGYWGEYANPGDNDAASALRLRGPFYLLVGLAFENFAKAVIVKRKVGSGMHVTEGDVLAIGGGSHNLVLCVTQAGVTVDDVERSLLRNLSQFVQWQGRYPVPTSARKMGQDTMTGTADMKMARRFWKRLNEEYNRER